MTRHKRTRPYTSRTNGKVERYNGTLLNEWIRKRPYDSEADRTAALVDFLNYYNNKRPHSSIGYVPPVNDRGAHP
jgi:transposase InsO family protein